MFWKISYIYISFRIKNILSCAVKMQKSCHFTFSVCSGHLGCFATNSLHLLGNECRHVDQSTGLNTIKLAFLRLR